MYKCLLFFQLLLMLIGCGCEKESDSSSADDVSGLRSQTDRVEIYKLLKELNHPGRVQSLLNTKVKLSNYPISLVLDIVCNDSAKLSEECRIKGLSYVSDRNFLIYRLALPTLLNDPSEVIRNYSLAFVKEEDITTDEIPFIENMLDDNSLNVRIRAAKILYFHSPDNSTLLDSIISSLSFEVRVTDNESFYRPPWKVAKTSLQDLREKNIIDPNLFLLKAKNYRNEDSKIFYHLISLYKGCQGESGLYEFDINFDDKHLLDKLDEIYEQKIAELGCPPQK